ncbi:unnamed protein product [Dovyalis caffra]|uniref:VQ domain-containing protein n=1 Tax=Dovyalis caffra TaxID=77055 RepID=A0AAV1S9A1_9ROSI|nr:unnamed protein product [Dovyalis caffra]
MDDEEDRMCKNIDEKKQYSNLNQALRPKVYITDNSNFNRLVQELTGNRNMVSSPPPQITEQVQEVMGIDILGNHETESSRRMESSVIDARPVDSFDSLNQMVVSEEINQTWNQIYADVTTFDLRVDQQRNFLAARGFESWLLEIDQPCMS